MSRAMPLHALLQDHVEPLPAVNPLVTGLCSDSRALRGGDAFIALAGASTHGLRFLPQASHIGKHVGTFGI